METTNVIGYLRRNRLLNGFITVAVNNVKLLKSDDVHCLFNGHATRQMAFASPQTEDHLIIVYDNLLHTGPMGLIRTPYLILKKIPSDGSYIDLEEDDMADIEISYFMRLNDDNSKCFLVVLDKKLHNDGTNNCPYLIFAFCHAYNLQNMMEDNVLDVADIIYILERELPRE
ncbi:hypothetical protein L210DRAFT_3650245 [Boletus edulis BED1]|uniref:Uncharacterized protein n=1 Tax=Boletus edulis BED1 TaxID=1328754 RepID=A0AAD4G9S8_BOLED|nr:hypothetical protein L210DRAFT_3650245 [Boletus edulis BED1]